MRIQHLFIDPSTSTLELANDLVAGIAINSMNQPHVSRIALAAYRRLLGLVPLEPMSRPEFGEFGASFMKQLLADAELLQRTGLDQMGADLRHRLLARYQAHDANPCAEEIVGWQRGEYAFDPQCLTS